MKKISEIHVTSSTAVSPTPRLVGDLKPTGIIWVPRLGGGSLGQEGEGSPARPPPLCPCAAVGAVPAHPGQAAVRCSGIEPVCSLALWSIL